MKLKNNSRIRSVFSGLNRAIIGFSFLVEFQRGLSEPQDYQKGFEYTNIEMHITMKNIILYSYLLFYNKTISYAPYVLNRVC